MITGQGNGTTALLVAWWISLGGSIMMVSGKENGETPPLLPATPQQLPRWRGFNLLEKFHRDWNNQPFVEDDFRHISHWGFNFVRLPMDYRVWIQEARLWPFLSGPGGI